MNQLRRNIVMAFSLLALQACGSGSTDSTQPQGGGEDTTPSLECGSSKLHSARHDACAPMVAQGEGACGCISMGWTWDGSACVALAAGACKCVGEDCDKLAKSKEECETSHAACLPELKSVECSSHLLFEQVHDNCGRMDVRGDGACNCMSMGWTWDGTGCVPLAAGACKCLGQDCDKLSPTQQDCLSKHAACL